MGSQSSDPLTIQVPPGYATHGQFRHLLLLVALLPGAWFIAEPTLGQAQWLGVSDRAWFVMAMAVPIVQQIGVAVFWRAELCHSLLTRALGNWGFVAWGVFFFPLLLGRPLTLIALGVADQGSLPLAPGLGYALGTALLLPAIWTMHSVKKYFGFARALGGDHFFERYRAMPMVRGGAFKYTSNAMYALAFLAFWGIALILQSRAALAVALFQHAYIWVHWYCTEQPDGVVLYGRSQDESE